MNGNTISIALAGVTFVLTLIWGQPMIGVLHRFSITDHNGQSLMGGWLIIIPVVMITILLHMTMLILLDGTGRSILYPLSVLVVFGALGSFSDWRRSRSKFSTRASVRVRFAAQIVLALSFALGLRYLLRVPDLYFPFYQGLFPLSDFWYIFWATIIILLLVNGTQVMDGVDGLTGLVIATGFVAYGAVAIAQGQIFVARFCFAMTGALIGFLWFNVKPASLNLGRTGTYGIGAALAVVALMTSQWSLLFLIAIVPIAEVTSVALKLILRKKMIMPIPIHKFYESLGWSTTQIVQRFWLVSLLFATIGFTLALV